MHTENNPCKNLKKKRRHGQVYPSHLNPNSYPPFLRGVNAAQITAQRRRVTPARKGKTKSTQPQHKFLFPISVLHCTLMCQPFRVAATNLAKGILDLIRATVTILALKRRPELSEEGYVGGMKN